MRLSGATKRLLNIDDVVPAFNCRLTKSGSHLLLSRESGPFLFINGKNETIPAAGVQIDPSGTASNLHYIYAWRDGAYMALEKVGTAPAVDSTYGHMIKSGAPTHTLVGVAQASSNAWIDDGNRRYVASYYNRREVSAENSNTVIGLSTSQTRLGCGSNQANFLCWGDDSVDIYFTGYGSCAAVGNDASFNIGLDGVNGPIGGVSAYMNMATGGAYEPGATRATIYPARGPHTVHDLGYTQNTQAWAITFYVGARVTI